MMTKVTKIFSGLAAGAATLALAAGFSPSASAEEWVALLLPENVNPRWESQDARFFIESMGEIAPDVTVEVFNANNDTAAQQRQAEQALTRGAAVLVVIPIDGESSAVIADSAAEAGVPTIAYDRMINSENTSFWVQADLEGMGYDQAMHVIENTKDGDTLVMLKGSPTDPNAAVIFNGQMRALQSLYDSGARILGYENWTQGWDPAIARRSMDQALTQLDNNVQGVVSSNDGNASAAIASLAEQGMAGTIPVPQPLGRPLAHRRQRRSRHRRTEELGHHLRQTILRQEVGVLQVDRHPGDARAVLHRRRYPVGERRPGHRPAMPAAPGMRPVLGHLQRTRLGQIEDLAGDRRSRLGRVRKRRTASLAGRRHVILHPIQVIGAAQRLALVAGLPTGLAARFAAQASGSPLRLRLLQPIARRRLAAVAAVEVETALQLLYALDETRDLLFQPRVLLPKPGVFLPKPGVLLFQVGDLLRGRFGRCSRRRAARRLGIAHVVVESFPEIPVKPLAPMPNATRLNPLAKNDKSDDLGSYVFFGIPSFVVTLAGLLGFQGLMLKILGIQGAINMRDPAVRALTTVAFPPAWGWGLGIACALAFAAFALHDQMRRRARNLEADSVAALCGRIAFIAILVLAAVGTLNNYRGVPLLVVVLVALTAILGWITTSTPFGRSLFAVGGNAETARRAGMSVRTVRVAAFGIVGLMAAIGGIVGASRYASVSFNAFAGGPLLLEAIGAAVIGGTSLFGGRGSVWNAILGALVIGSLGNGLDLSGASAADKLMFSGAILLLAAAMDAVSRQGANFSRGGDAA